MRHIFIAAYGHETNTFVPAQTTVEEFGGKQLLLDRSYLGNRLCNYVDFFQQYPDVRLTHSVSAWAAPWGKIASKTHQFIKNTILSDLKNAGPVDGILLVLHGAMVIEDNEDGEGDLLSAIREQIGTAIPIGVVLDLHANITQAMERNATWLINYDTYPHIDAKERDIESATMMMRYLAGSIHPVMVCKHLPMLLEFMPTTQPPMADIAQEMFVSEKISGILSASVAHGFFCADIYESGATVVVIADGNEDLAQTEAKRIAEKLWSVRAQCHRDYVPVEEAIADVKAHPDRWPVVFADCCDNPGGGSPGDTTTILRALLASGIPSVLFLYLNDAEAVAQAEAIGVGHVGEIALGGKSYPQETGKPVIAQAYVRAITDGNFDYGLTPPDFELNDSGRTTIRSDWPPTLSGQHGKIAVLDVNSMEILATTVKNQTWNDRSALASGIVPWNHSIIVVKSTVHFRACFEKYAKKIYNIWAPGFSEQSIKHCNLQNCRRPIYPLDDI